MADKKFVNLHESYMRRYQRGGFLVGDVFKFNDDFKSTDGFKDLGSNTQELLQQMIDSGLNVRVVGIKDTEPARYPASSQTSTLDVVLDLALDTGGGRYSHHVSIPGSLGQSVEYYPNLPPIPDVMRRKGETTIKPEEAETTIAPDAVEDPKRELPTSNTDIPSDPVTPSPAATSYTMQYLGDLTPGPSAY
jgi:hypothetical protein|tara:strand:- start:132 stop:704 length:573 start_codon:yes stop_codon:yes gene_type:complete